MCFKYNGIFNNKLIANLLQSMSDSVIVVSEKKF